jgi:hypothetical protein
LPGDTQHSLRHEGQRPRDAPNQAETAANADKSCREQCEQYQRSCGLANPPSIVSRSGALADGHGGIIFQVILEFIKQLPSFAAIIRDCRCHLVRI